MIRYILFLMAGFWLTICLALCVFFFVPRSIGGNSTPLANDATDVSIYVAQYAYHTGIIMPVRTSTYAWSKDFPCLLGSEYVEVGWGDRQYYMAGEATSAMALEALFASKSSVASVVGLDKPPFTTAPARVKRVRLSADDYTRLVGYFVWAFQFRNGKPVFLREGFWGARSAFYEANAEATGEYNIVNNCNAWSAAGLRTAHLQTPLWAALPQPLLWMLPDE